MLFVVLVVFLLAWVGLWSVLVLCDDLVWAGLILVWILVMLGFGCAACGVSDSCF